MNDDHEARPADRQVAAPGATLSAPERAAKPLCFAISEDRGWQSPLFGHFGSSPYLAFVTPGEDSEPRVVANPDRRHQRGRCRPFRAMGMFEVGAVVVRGIGSRALLTLNEGSVPVFRITSARLSEALAEHLRGDSVLLEPPRPFQNGERF
jgi:predicted Fe-Mo cluster-binding NifX family protein